jgi:hypothetical protein
MEAMNDPQPEGHMQYERGALWRAVEPHAIDAHWLRNVQRGQGYPGHINVTFYLTSSRIAVRTAASVAAEQPRDFDPGNFTVVPPRRFEDPYVSFRQLRTCLHFNSGSNVPLKTHAPQQTPCIHSLNQLVGAQQQCFGNFQSKRLGGGGVDDEIELGRLLDRDVARLPSLSLFIRNGVLDDGDERRGEV